MKVRMEQSRSGTQCTLFNALFLLAWASCLVTVQNLTGPASNVPHQNLADPASNVSCQNLADPASNVSCQNLTDPDSNVSRPNPTDAASNMNNDSQLHNPYDIYAYFAEGCWLHYISLMSKVDVEHFCEWRHVNRPYSFLQGCLENLTELLRLPFPNEVADKYIMRGHTTYFVNCTLHFVEMRDPPENVLLALIISPICIIPFMVALVVCKSKTSKTQN